MEKMLDYLVTTYEGSFDIKDVEKIRKNLLKEHEQIELIQVKSVYYNEKAIVFCTEGLEEEKVLEWFEKERDNFFANQE